MKVSINNKEYIISDIAWEKHSMMHPIRPHEALISNVKVAVEGEVTTAKLEKMIEEEYDVQNNMDNIVTEARALYEDR